MQLVLSRGSKINSDHILEISKYLPFYYLRYGVVQIFLGKLGLNGSLQLLAIQLFWIMFLGILVNILWKVAMKKYGAVGG